MPVDGNLAVVYFALWLAALLTSILALWGSYLAIIDRPVIFKQLILAAGVEVMMLGSCGVAIVQQLAGHPVADPITLWGYLLTCLILLPIAGAWAVVDRTRTSSIAMVVIAVSLVVCQWRVWQVWVA